MKKNAAPLLVCFQFLMLVLSVCSFVFSQLYSFEKKQFRTASYIVATTQVSQ